MRWIYKSIQYLIVCPTISLILGCGGGASPAGSAAETPISGSNQSSTNSSTSDPAYFDFVTFWNKSLASEFSNSGIISGYGYKDFRYTKLQ